MFKVAADLIKHPVSVLALAAVCALPCTPAAAQSVADFYAGKQITLIVGATPGGGYDAQARLLAKHFSRYIPGQPVVTVQNMPAAGSLAAANHIANVAPRDGTVIALVQRGMLLIKNWNPSQVRFELDKLGWIGSISREVGISASWYTTTHKTIQDLFDRELIIGGTTGIDPETTPRLLNALIGTKFKIITGYPGTTEIALAMERGEVQGIGDWSWSSLNAARPAWVAEKKINILLQAALQRAPELPSDLPFALDYVKNDADRKVMELYLTQKTVARPLITPPGLPADRLAALRTAFAGLARDQEFLADAQRTKLDVSPVLGEEVDRIVGLIASASPETARRLGAAISDK